MGKNNGSKLKSVMYLAITAVAIVIAVGVVSPGTFNAGTTTAPTTTTTTGTPVSDVIAGSVSPTGQIIIGDALNKNAAALTHTVRYRNAGSTGPFKSTLTATDISFAPEASYEFFTNSSGEYGVYPSSVKIPAIENVPENLLTFSAYDMATASSMSSAVRDPNGDANTNSANWTYSAGDVKTFTWKIGGQYQDAYGDPNARGQAGEICKNIMTIKYNTTAVDAIAVTLNGVDLTSAPTPQQSGYTVQSYQSTKSFYFDPVVSNAEVDFRITIDTDDTVALLNDINLTAFDVTSFIGNDNLVHCGVEDSDNTNIGIIAHLSDLIEAIELGE